MKDCILKIKENGPIARGTMKMVLEGDVSAVTAPGQFVNIKIDGLFLRRPMSVSDCVKYAEDSEAAEEAGAAGSAVSGTKGLLTIVYKVVGQGTEKLAAMEPGEELQVLTGLGNGFWTENIELEAEACGSGLSVRSKDPSGAKVTSIRPLLVGGGVGTSPLLMLAKELRAKGLPVCVVMGFASAEEVYYEQEFLELGCSVTVATADGSKGIKGFVTDALAAGNASGSGCARNEGISACNYVYTCGPEPMLKALYKACTLPGQYSFEERMGCGFGACMGCSCRTVTGYKRICKDGPVLERKEILWQD